MANIVKLLTSIQAKRNKSMCVHDNIGYAEMIEEKVTKKREVEEIDKKIEKAIKYAARERKRFPELYGVVNWKNPQKYLIPVSIRVKAKRIYYALKDALS